jgi:hypothetical protein
MRTAHCAGEPLGWAVITHPFHPRRGERFRVLKARRYRGQATLILEGGEGGPFCILEDWTDKAAPTNAGARATGPGPTGAAVAGVWRASLYQVIPQKP